MTPTNQQRRTFIAPLTDIPTKNLPSTRSRTRIHHLLCFRQHFHQDQSVLAEGSPAARSMLLLAFTQTLLKLCDAPPSTDMLQLQSLRVQSTVVRFQCPPPGRSVTWRPSSTQRNRQSKSPARPAAASLQARHRCGSVGPGGRGSVLGAGKQVRQPGGSNEQEFPDEDSIFHPAVDPRQDPRRGNIG